METRSDAGELVLVAGASGALGGELLRALGERGYRTRALIRDPAKREALAGAGEVAVVDLLDPGEALGPALAGVDFVFSCAGQASVMAPTPARASFRAVDLPINRALLAAAEAAAVRRFVYVAVLNGPELRDLAYVDAHELVVDELRASPIPHTVLRANGFFSTYLELLEMARAGLLVALGDPGARSNPIHEADLAAACVEALQDREEALDVGGPETLSRGEELEAVIAAAGRRPRVRHPPAALVRVAATALSLRDRRRAEMLRFALAITSRDMIAPAHGGRRLADYLRDHASLDPA